MIKFVNNNLDAPYVKFKEEYERAVSANQKIVEAITISSYSKLDNLVDSRYVNLKIVDNKEFIFFSNYNSPKSTQFESHDQISALIYWNTTNVQIRMKANIKKTPVDFNNKYFATRSKDKNALAISSKQSQKIDSYDSVMQIYNDTKKDADLEKCPDYWGGFVFRPYYFEFWEGHDSRLNRRMVFELNNNQWNNFFLQP
tara:strand:- start:1094 stop:1690 length:597 start_codon:yes stop_codon:yes gene_type:complete